ncbi:hypothetical protein RFI_39050 [Reticulomyxa filosa]|uniref:EGF-like domain-containing protein n=1 Tax=Reticulomyxa filosa TaxID=46433 RepID=X6LA98_RETFI|nr:hypothetical protein RFI_39050 [Reticulomyxa filosa]|eukprot:ETN98448.1 hypothetical protein RFI_39050 [Reticulomyxa filosa]
MDTTTCSKRRRLTADSSNITTVFNYSSLNSSEKEYLNTTCDNNYQCIYDLYYTQDEQIALATKSNLESFIAEQKKIANNFECISPCQNNGTCLDNNICNCSYGFDGDRCQYNLSLPSYNQQYISSVLTYSPTVSPSIAPSPRSSNKQKSISTASIVGIVVGIAALVLAIIMYCAGYKMGRKSYEPIATVEMQKTEA